MERISCCFLTRFLLPCGWVFSVLSLSKGVRLLASEIDQQEGLDVIDSDMDTEIVGAEEEEGEWEEEKEEEEAFIEEKEEFIEDEGEGAEKDDRQEEGNGHDALEEDGGDDEEEEEQDREDDLVDVFDVLNEGDDDEDEEEEDQKFEEEEYAQEEESDDSHCPVRNEWEATVGRHDFFGDLGLLADFDDRFCPDNAMYSSDELRGNVACSPNPFDLYSYWVDREIVMGNVDEKVCCPFFARLGECDMRSIFIDNTRTAIPL